MSPAANDTHRVYWGAADDSNWIAAPDMNDNAGPMVPMGHCGSFNQRFKEQAMGKCVLRWILGVPAIVLVVIYLFMD
jgi:hypothetical protein